jgi:hypothetical protein
VPCAAEQHLRRLLNRVRAFNISLVVREMLEWVKPADVKMALQFSFSDVVCGSSACMDPLRQ